MKTILLTLIAFLPFVSKLSAQSDLSNARWIPNGIVIDGNDDEWVKPLNCYDDKSGLMFAVGNDQHDLYLCFTCNDEMKMRKMMNAGWKITLSSKEKKQKFKAEIDFPAVNMRGAGMGMGFRNNTDREGSSSMIANPINIYRLNLGPLPIKGFISNKTDIKLNDKSDIDIAIGVDKNQHIIYEFAIPFKDLYGEIRLGLNEEITMNFTVNGIERPNSAGGSFGGGSPRMGGGSHIHREAAVCPEWGAEAAVAEWEEEWAAAIMAEECHTAEVTEEVDSEICQVCLIVLHLNKNSHWPGISETKHLLFKKHNAFILKIRF